MILRKNIIAIGLLFLVAAPICIFTTLFVFQKIAQHSMKEKLEEASLQTIVLSTNDFIWIEKDREIKIGNEMFDVKSYTKKVDRFVFIGLYDKVEKKINKQINKLVKNKNNNQSSNDLLVLKLCQSVCVISNTVNLPTPFYCIHKKAYCFFNEKDFALSKPTHIHPPIL